MHYYKIEIIETEGRLNESNGPAPAVVYLESNKCLSERQALICASKKYKNMYGTKIVVADVEQISEGVWDSIKGAASGLGGLAGAAGNAVGKAAKAVGNAVGNAAGKVKNTYVNSRNASRMKGIVNNITKIINSQLAPQVQSASKFGGFTVEQLQQIKGAIDQVMNGAAVQNQNNAQAQGPNAEEQAGADMTNAAINNAATTSEAEEDFI